MSVYICIFKHTHNDPLFYQMCIRIDNFSCFHILKIIQCVCSMSQNSTTLPVLLGAAPFIQIYSYFYINMHDISYGVR